MQNASINYKLGVWIYTVCASALLFSIIIYILVSIHPVSMFVK